MVWIVDLPRESAAAEQATASPFYQTFHSFLGGIGLPEEHWHAVLSKLDYSKVDASYRLVASLNGSRPDSSDCPWGYVGSTFQRIIHVALML